MSVPGNYVDASGWQVNGVPVVVASAAVLCPDCLGDWCPSCNWSGLNLPAQRAATVTPLPLGQPEPVTGRAA